MPSAWLTYAWADNERRDVDYIAQELVQSGIDIKLDRWNLTAGIRLWSQIEKFIQDPRESDAWLLYATQNSLGSEPCREEFAYALDRALNKRGARFPVIALFQSSLNPDLVPAGIRTRLHVSVTDPDWKERIASAIRGESPSISRMVVEPYDLRIHDFKVWARTVAIEVRPLAGTWSPFVAAIPFHENTFVKIGVIRGASGTPPVGGGISFGDAEGQSTDKKWWIFRSTQEATPTQSFYIICDKLPSVLIFGREGSPQ